MSEGPKHPEVEVRLSDEDGNAFVLIGRTGGALKRAGLRSEAEVFYQEATACGSYDEVLQLIMRTVSTS